MLDRKIFAPSSNESVSGLNWKIAHPCPQCGAPVTLEETDRILTCAFCRTRLFISASDHFRYYIPPPGGSDANTVFIPYWRVRGLTYTVEPLRISNRYIDTNISAVSLPGLPPSLGLRPQAMTLKFISPGIPGNFLRPQRTLQDAVPEADHAKFGISHRCLFIGETTSLIYTPMILKDDMLHDSFLKKSMASWHPDDKNSYPPNQSSLTTHFIPTLCPHCGWDLQGEKDALALTCTNCNSLWICEKGAFVQAPFAVMGGTADSVMYLPFWRIKPHITGLEASSYADFIRLANLPKAITASMEDRPFYAWSPAFKVNPALFLRWARQMTVFQPEDRFEDKLPSSTAYPVTLPREEALESVLVTLGSVVTDKRAFFKGLSDIQVTPDESLLVYHPFIRGDRELTHEKMGLVMETNALRYGATM